MKRVGNNLFCVVHGSGENAHRERLPKPPARWYRLRARDDDENSIYEERDKAERERVRMTGGVISDRPSRFRPPNYRTSHQQMPLDGEDNPAKQAKPAKPDSYRSHT